MTRPDAPPRDPGAEPPAAGANGPTARPGPAAPVSAVPVSAAPVSAETRPEAIGPDGAGPDVAGPHAAGLSDRAAVVLADLMMHLPYGARIRLAGRASRLMARVNGIRRRTRRAVLHLFPDVPEPELARLCTAVADSMGRTAVEILSGDEFYRHAAGSPVEGPGLAALDQARREGRAVLLMTSHFGNAAAVGAVLKARGFDVATFYKPFPGPAFNRRYVAAVEAITAPLFPAGREGVASMVRHLRRGGMISISFDLDRAHGEVLDFLGKPARTVLSMAEMALRYDALLVPVYGIRQPDGLNFRVRIDAPIPAGTPRAMMQAVNDSLGQMVTAHKDQWLWWHKRWKRGHPVDVVAD